jgi:hypothetical protein
MKAIKHYCRSGSYLELLPAFRSDFRCLNLKVYCWNGDSYSFFQFGAKVIFIVSYEF